MLIYNITFKVDHEKLNDWMQWQKEIHIPEMIATGCFYDHRFYELLEHEEEDGKTFVIQFYADSKNDYDKYLQNFAAEMKQKSADKWNDHVISFRTLLQAVQ
jgi:quinol monooxygenase YgiN